MTSKYLIAPSKRPRGAQAVEIVRRDAHVSHYSTVSFMLNICMEIVFYLQIMVLFVGIVHIFLFSVIL